MGKIVPHGKLPGQNLGKVCTTKSRKVAWGGAVFGIVFWKFVIFGKDFTKGSLYVV